MTERGKVLNLEYNIFRDQPIAGASPLRINTLLYRVFNIVGQSAREPRVVTVHPGRDHESIGDRPDGNCQKPKDSNNEET